MVITRDIAGRQKKNGEHHRYSWKEEELVSY